MTFYRATRFTLAFILLAAPAAAGAQAFGLNEIGSCAIARGFAATASPCDDASSIYWNPGALPKARGLSMLAGIDFIAVNGDFIQDTTGLKYDGDVPVAVAAMRAGAVDFLVKPVPCAVLVDRVRQAFGRHEALEGPRTDVDHSRRLVTLTPREREVFDLMVTGVSSKHIARALDCSFRTIDIHRARVMTKMAAHSLAELVRMEVRSFAVT